MAAKPKIAFLDTGWAANEYRKKTGHYGAIAYYRLVKPLEYLKPWFQIDFFGKRLKSFGEGNEAYIYLAQNYDLIYSKHIDNGAGASALLAMAQHFKKKILVDLDDNYLQIRDDNPAAKDYAPFKGGRYFLGAFMSLADGLTISTEPLKEVYKFINEKRDVLPNCNDVYDWSFKRVIYKDDKVRIGYMGSITHNDDLELIWEPLAKLLNRYPKVRFEVLGAIDAPKIKEVFEKMSRWCPIEKLEKQMWFFGGTGAWLGYPQLLLKMGWDIGIAPLVDEPFNHCKSHIKWMEYSMAGIPTVASNVYPYCQPIQGVETIVHGKTGLLVKNNDEWAGYLELLVKNSILRRELADNAYVFIKENWQWKQHIGKWKQVFEKYL